MLDLFKNSQFMYKVLEKFMDEMDLEKMVEFWSARLSKEEVGKTQYC